MDNSGCRDDGRRGRNEIKKKKTLLFPSPGMKLFLHFSFLVAAQEKNLKFFFLQSDTHRAVRLQKKKKPDRGSERGDRAPRYILPFYLSKPGQFED